MGELLGASASALWLGILTSISPCPLATNIAAVSYIGQQLDRPRRVLWSGLLYAAGRTAAYALVAAALILSLLSAPVVSHFLQKYMIVVLGPILIVTALVLLGAINLPAMSRGVSARLQERVDRMGIAGAGVLGFVFALSFCPVSAALFFGSLIPLAIEARSGFWLPSVYGVGTALPVVGFAILIGCAANLVGRAFESVVRVEKWARRVTAIVFLGIGVYFTLVYTLRVFR